VRRRTFLMVIQILKNIMGRASTMLLGLSHILCGDVIHCLLSTSKLSCHLMKKLRAIRRVYTNVVKAWVRSNGED
jgi:hypothetical protein